MYVLSVNHVLSQLIIYFFNCQLSFEVWQKVLTLLKFARRPGGFTDELQWVIKSCKRGGHRHRLLKIFFAESVYGLWLNRNDQIYNMHCKTSAALFREVQFRVASRASEDLVSFLLDLSFK